jgi:hypothetical protein
MNSDPDHSVIDNKTHRGIIFLKAVPHRSKTETVSRHGNCHQGCIVDCFVGLHEAHATLALWLGWMQHYYSI